MDDEETWTGPSLTEPPTTGFDDVARLETAKAQLREALVVPATDEQYDRVGASGVLFHGPPGTGKTRFAEALLAELGVPYVDVRPSELPLSDPDAAADAISEVFALAREQSPAAVLLDDIETLAAAPDGEEWATDRPSQRVVTLRNELDRIDDPGVDVLAVATTARLGAINPAVRRSGRVDLTIALEDPDDDRKRAVLVDELERVTDDTDLALDGGLSFRVLVPKLHAFSVADVVEVARRAARAAAAEADCTAICQDHLRDAIESVADDRDYSTDPDDAGEDDEEPGLGDLFGSSDDEDDGDEAEGSESTNDESDSEGDGEDDGEVFVGQHTTIEPPEVTYDDVGGLAAAKQRLRELIEWPRTYPEKFAELEIDTAHGVLLYGPPGTGKTLLAKAVANETDSNFISVKGPEILDKYVGESERAIRNIFQLARENTPAVVFFDELDAIAPNRGGYAGENDVLATVVNQLLSELDGFEALSEVVVIGATNRPDAIDPALLRPGRFGEAVPVGAPDEQGRQEIFSVHTADRPLAEDADLAWLASTTDGRYTGADIAAVCEAAAMAAMRESVVDNTESVPEISRAHFEAALASVEPSGETHREDRERDLSYQ